MCEHVFTHSSTLHHTKNIYGRIKIVWAQGLEINDHKNMSVGAMTTQGLKH